MKKIILATIILFHSCLNFAQTKKAIFIISEGIPADLIEKVNTPTLAAIAKVSGYAHAHESSPEPG